MQKINFQYTFGEILIVIIGITIAFSMNKCAEDSKEARLRTQYLKSLKIDVESDKATLKNNVDAIEEKMVLADEVLPIINTSSTEKMQTIGKIFKIVQLTNFIPNENTYNTLINSGDLKLIDDFKTKAAIEKHYSNYEILEQSYQRQENIQKKYIADYFIYHVDYDDFPNGEFGFKNEALLKNILRSARGSLELKRDATVSGIKSCDTLIMVIDTELNN